MYGNIMLILKCTQKAAKEFGVQRSKLPQLSAEDDATLLGAWFVNAIKLGRSKALIFMNAETLYSFLVLYHKKDLVDLHRLFIDSMKASFHAEALATAGVERVLEDYRHGVMLARTDDRRVLGVMNDAVANYKILIQIQREGGNAPDIDMVRITRTINRMLQWKHDGALPIDVLRERLASV